MFGLNTYPLQARLIPYLLVVAPIGTSIVAWFPEKFPGWGLLVGMLTSIVAATLCSNLGRDPGKARENELWREWGGVPTTQLLRYRCEIIDPYTKQRYHQKLSQLTGLAPPSTRKESSNPAEADAVYASWVARLKELTRDRKQHSLLFSSLIDYGFRRNLYCMKPAAVIIALLGTIASCFAAVFRVHDSTWPVAAIITLVNATLLTIWLLRINSAWVRVIAFQYAKQLLASCEVISAS